MRDTNWRGRLICYLVNVDGDVPIARMDAFDECNRIVATVDDMFAMDDFERPRKTPYYSGTPSLRKQKSQELLRILSSANARQHQTASAYMVPERMATAHHPMQVYPANLNEISETLRSLLKIHGQ